MNMKAHATSTSNITQLKKHIISSNLYQNTINVINLSVFKRSRQNHNEMKATEATSRGVN